MKSRLKVLVAEREFRTGDKISQRVIAEQTGLDENTISSWMNPNTRIKRIETRTVVALCGWLDCELGELLVLEPTEQATA